MNSVALMKVQLAIFCLAFVMLGCVTNELMTADDQWSAEVNAIVAKDRAAEVKPGGVVFVGSSTIRKWDLGQSFPEVHALNHGFGGSQMKDAVRYEKQLVSALQPRLVVLYSGDNDIESG